MEEIRKLRSEWVIARRRLWLDEMLPESTPNELTRSKERLKDVQRLLDTFDPYFDEFRSTCERL